MTEPNGTHPSIKIATHEYTKLQFQYFYASHRYAREHTNTTFLNPLQIGIMANFGIVAADGESLNREQTIELNSFCDSYSRDGGSLEEEEDKEMALEWTQSVDEDWNGDRGMRRFFIHLEQALRVALPRYRALRGEWVAPAA